MIIIMRKQKLNKLLSESFQWGLERGYGLGQIAGAAEARNRGCILSSLGAVDEAERILKENEDGREYA